MTTAKLGGRLNIADMVTPAQTDTTLMAAEMAIAAGGRAVSMIAVAAGVTTSANNSSVPTAYTAMVIANPSNAMKIMDSSRTGSPFASATGALTEENNNGR